MTCEAMDAPQTYTQQANAGLSSCGFNACGCQESGKQRIAIIGYSCRLPGEVSSPADLWELCTRKRSGWTPIPKTRFSAEAFQHPNPSKTGTFNPKAGYFLQDDISRFDAPFFNISAQEAISLDPQQRLLLECSYEAIESAGIPKEKLSGRNVGVFVGSNFVDYELHNMRDVETIPMYQATGCAPSLQSNRISYFFNLRGPSVTIDTACSSSLVALHTAVQSLRLGESTEAIVAGCRLNIVPDLFVSMSMSQLFNDDGKTYAFDNRATSGFARGEGAGVVVLKLLDDAIKDRDPIRAVIVNSGVNQDGRTQGITMPNGQAQEELIRRVYREAHIDPHSCGFVEMHGTGTKVGDPIEAAAVHAALGSGRSPKSPLYIGSVKSNVGHLEGASGVISLIKAAMMLDRDLLLPNFDFKTANENIPLGEWNMKVVTSTRPWPADKKFVSVSNYGFGGTNAHAVLEKAPLSSNLQHHTISRLDNEHTRHDPKQKLILISANDKESLQRRINDHGVYFEQRPEVFEKELFSNLAFTLGSKLSHLSYRIALPALSLDDLGIRLAQLQLDAVKVLRSPRISFIFTGQGAQWPQMGVVLMEKYPVFNAAIQEADDILRHLQAKWSLIEHLKRDPALSEIDSPEISQPACTAVQIALVKLLQSWGISPCAVLGHSSGEIAASFAAGIYSDKSAMALSFHRGQMTRMLKETHPNLQGGMIAVQASVDTIQPIIKTIRSGYVAVACVNSSTSTTISGDSHAIQELEMVLSVKNIPSRRLKIDVAYHSDHMLKVSEEYEASISHIKPKSSGKSDVTFYSSVLGCEVHPSTLNAAYWVQNLISPVLFSDALCAMSREHSECPDLLIEIGPHCGLKGPIRDSIQTFEQASDQIAYSPTIIRDADPVQSLMCTAAAAYVRGADLDICEINFPNSGAQNCTFLTDLPRYPWQHRARYWHEPRIVRKHQMRAGARHDMLGVIANYSNDMEPTWRNIIHLDDLPWLRDHKMQGIVVYPLAGYISMALEAAAHRAQELNIAFSSFELREVVVESALTLDDDSDIEITISLRPYNSGTRNSSSTWDQFIIHSWKSSRGWIEHCHGLIGVRKAFDYGEFGITDSNSKNIKSFHNTILDVAQSSKNEISEECFYEHLSSIGVEYGPSFKGLENCYANSYHSRADLCVRDTTSLMPKQCQSTFIAHPAFLDGLLHLVWPVLGHGTSQLQTLYMPTLLSHATISLGLPSDVGQRVKIFGTGSPDLDSPQPTRFDLFAVSNESSSELLIVLSGLVMTPIRDRKIANHGEVRKLCYKMVWQPWALDMSDGGENGKRKNEIDTAIENRAKTVSDDYQYDTLDRSDEVKSETPVPPIKAGFAVNGILSPTHKTSNHAFAEWKAQSCPYILVRFSREAQNQNHSLFNDLVNELSAFSDTACLTRLETAQYDNRQVIMLQSSDASLRHISAKYFETLQRVLLSAASVLWIYDSDSPNSQLTVGLTRSVRSENLANITTLGLPYKSPQIALNSVLNAIQAIELSNQRGKSKENEFKLSNSKLVVLKALEDAESSMFVHTQLNDVSFSEQPFHQSERRFKLEIAKTGSLDTIYFADDSPNVLSDDSVEIEVRATGVNFKDVVVSMGQLSQPYIGIECSGIINCVGENVRGLSHGQRVMAITEGGYSTFANCPSTSVVSIPEFLSFEEAATIPVVFCTAYYGLFDLGHLSAGERVLIHAGAGGVGQAAIQLALMKGADIYVTVGSQKKKDFLMHHYNVPEDRILFSRNNSFGEAVRILTKNQGVDVVLNSLSGDLLRESWNCIAPFGRFIEIGKADISKNTYLEMMNFEHNVTFSSVDLSKVSRFRPKLMQRLLCDVHGLLSEGLIKPVFPITTYSISEVEAAFRGLQTGQNIGKSVVVARSGDKIRAVSRSKAPDFLRKDGTYIIFGGTGGLGRSIAKWMSERGAKVIVLASRSGSMTEKLRSLAAQLATRGTQVMVKKCDVSSKPDIENLVNIELQDLPPVRGIVLATMVLRDILFEKMTLEDFHSVCACKVEGAWNLHHVLARSPLEFFTALSSVAGVIGNRGQSAYSAANAFLDGFMEYRQSLGLPGKSIDLAAVTNAGYLAESATSRKEEITKNIGNATINESEVLALVALAIESDLKKCSQSQFIAGLDTAERDDMFWMEDAKFSVIRGAADVTGRESQQANSQRSLRLAVQSAPTREDAILACYQSLVGKLATVLGLSSNDMNTATRVNTLGLDSLVAIEIRNWIAREADANVQVLELLSSESLIKLAELILTKSKFYTHQ